MFGYIMMNADALPKERQARFRMFYCGLCRTLRARYGIIGSATLSYDMTFLAILLNALYEPGETSGEERCLAHPVKRHGFIDTPVLGYTADMNILLSYHKCLDNWADDKNVLSAAESALLKRAYSAARERYPEKAQAIVEWLDEIHDIEASGSGAIDPPVNATGRMLGALFAYHEDDIWADTLRRMGDGLGRFIYFMDAYEDLSRDLRKGSFNPLAGMRSENGFDGFCRAAMTDMVADATREFEMLPIVQDADILKNILYSGIWSRYVAMTAKRGKKKERKNAGSL